MDPCSKTIVLLAIEYPMKLEGLQSCLLPIGQSEETTRDSNACGTRSLHRGLPVVLVPTTAPTSLSGSERRVGEDPGNEFLAAPGSPRMTFT